MVKQSFRHVWFTEFVATVIFVGIAFALGAMGLREIPWQIALLIWPVLLVGVYRWRYKRF